MREQAEVEADIKILLAELGKLQTDWRSAKGEVDLEMGDKQVLTGIEASIAKTLDRIKQLAPPGFDPEAALLQAAVTPSVPLPGVQKPVAAPVAPTPNPASTSAVRVSSNIVHYNAQEKPFTEGPLFSYVVDVPQPYAMPQASPIIRFGRIIVFPLVLVSRILSDYLILIPAGVSAIGHKWNIDALKDMPGTMASERLKAKLKKQLEFGKGGGAR